MPRGALPTFRRRPVGGLTVWMVERPFRAHVLPVVENGDGMRRLFSTGDVLLCMNIWGGILRFVGEACCAVSLRLFSHGSALLLTVPDCRFRMLSGGNAWAFVVATVLV